MALTQSQIANVLRQAGWPEALIPVMSAIGMAESSGNASATRIRAAGQGQRLPERSVGLFQVNLLAWPQYAWDWLMDPVNNAKAALEIYKKQGLRAWGSYTDGRYKKYLGGVDASDFGTGGLGYDTAQTVFSNATGWYSWLLDPVAPANERFAPFVNSTPRLNQYVIAVGIMVLILAFVWSDFR